MNQIRDLVTMDKVTSFTKEQIISVILKSLNRRIAGNVKKEKATRPELFIDGNEYEMISLDAHPTALEE